MTFVLISKYTSSADVGLYCSFSYVFSPFSLTGLQLLLFFFFCLFALLYALPSCPWVFMVPWQAWHIALDCDALWQKINTSPLVRYGDKTVIILMLCLLWTLILPHNCSPRCPLLISLSVKHLVKEQNAVYLYQKKYKFLWGKETVTFMIKYSTFSCHGWVASIVCFSQ